MRSKITDEQAAAEVSKVTTVTSGGRMYMKPRDFFQLTRVREALDYARDEKFFERVLQKQKERAA